MPDQSDSNVPARFWIIASVALLWNLLGVMAYLQQVTMTPESLAELPAAKQALLGTTPAWATAAFAISVFGGALGCIALLLRKSWAIALFALSLLSIFVQMFHSFFLSNSFEVFGPGGLIMPVMVIAVAIYLPWLSMQARDKGWLI